MRRICRALGIVGVAASLAVGAFAGASYGERPTSPEKVVLCHRTGKLDASGNPIYRLIEVSASAEAQHLEHGDLHPEFGSCGSVGL